MRSPVGWCVGTRRAMRRGLGAMTSGMCLNSSTAARIRCRKNGLPAYLRIPALACTMTGALTWSAASIMAHVSSSLLTCVCADLPYGSLFSWLITLSFRMSMFSAFCDLCLRHWVTGADYDVLLGNRSIRRIIVFMLTITAGGQVGFWGVRGLVCRF